ncbi:MAG: AAA family ATPase [Candidatus Omnitrophota bacterium]
MHKKIFTYTILSIFIFNQICWSCPAHDTLRPAGTLHTDTRALEELLNDGTISFEERDALHQEKVDVPLAELYRQEKVKPLHDCSDLPTQHGKDLLHQLSQIEEYLFNSKGLNLKANMDLYNLYSWLILLGQAKAVYATKEEWPLRGHSSNYGDKNARMHIRVYDNDDIQATFVYEFGVLLGNNVGFNKMLEDDFKRWRKTNGKKHLFKNILIENLKDARLHTDLKHLITRDFTYCWGRRLPDRAAFEEVRTAWEETEKDVVDEAVEKIEALLDEDEDIDDETKQAIKDELKQNLNEDVIGGDLLEAALSGELGGLDDDQLKERILNSIVSKIAARILEKFGININPAKLKALLKDKDSIKKFLDIFKEKVIRKVKKEKGDKGSRKGESGGQAISRPGERERERESGASGYAGTSYFSLLSLRRLLSILGNEFYIWRTGIKEALIGGVDRIGRALYRAHKDIRRLFSIRVRVAAVDTGAGVFRVPVFFFAKDKDANNNAPQPPAAIPPELAALLGLGQEEFDISKFTDDMLQKARNGEYDDFYVGTKQRNCINRTLRRITQKKEAGVFIVGEPGVGKTVLVEYLARMIAERKTGTWLDARPRRNQPPVRLLNLKLVNFLKDDNIIDMKRLGALLDNISDGKTILFIDEVHILTQQPRGATSFLDYVKNALTGNKLKIIISTTEDECNRYMKDEAVNRRFEKIVVPVPSPDETIDIIEKIMPSLLAEVNPEDVSKDEYIYVDKSRELSFLRSLIRLADRFRAFVRPHNAKMTLRQTFNWMRQRRAENKREMDGHREEIVAAANELIESRRDGKTNSDSIENRHRRANKIINFARALLKAFSKRKDTFRYEVTVKDIADANDFPAGSESMESKEWFAGLGAKLRRRVRGQDHAITAVTEAVLVDRARPTKKRTHPAGIFFCAGPPGVGKSLTPKALAEELYPGDDQALIILNMADFADSFKASNFTGSSMGYVDSGKLPDLHQQVKTRPCSIIVFDDVDKAHPIVLDFLLTLLQEGKHLGVDFTKAYMFFTSNANLKPKDYNKDPAEILKTIERNIEGESADGGPQLRKELLDRIKGYGHILIYHFLSRPKMMEIVQKNYINGLREDFLDDLGIEIEVEGGTEQFLQTDDFLLKVDSPWQVTDDSTVISFDDEKMTLSASRRGEEFIIGQAAAEKDFRRSKKDEFLFEEGALTEPAMIKLIQQEGKIIRYLVADKQAGIVCFGEDGKLEEQGAIGEPTDALEVVGDNIYFHSTHDGFIKSCDLNGKNIKRFSKKAYKNFRSFCVKQEDSAVSALYIADGTDSIVALDAKGAEKERIGFDHTEQIKAKESASRRILSSLLSREAEFEKQNKALPIMAVELKSGQTKAIAVSGEKVYITDVGANIVRVYNASTGANIPADKIINWYAPLDIVVSKDKTQYRFDLSGNAVIKQVPAKEPEELIKFKGDDFGFGKKDEMAHLARIAIHKSGLIYLYNKKRNVLERYNTMGTLGSSSSALGEYVEDISDFALDADKGDVYLLDRQAKCIFTVTKKMELLVDAPAHALMAGQRPQAKVIDLLEIPDLDIENTRIYSVEGDSIYLYDTEKRELIEIDKKAKVKDRLKADEAGSLSIEGIAYYNGKYLLTDSRGNLFLLNEDLKVQSEESTYDQRGDYSLSLSNGNVLLSQQDTGKVRVFGDVNISPVAELIMEEGFLSKEGARSVEGAGNRLLKKKLELMYGSGEIRKGDKVKVSRRKDGLVLERGERKEEPNPDAKLTEMIAEDEDPEFVRIINAIEAAVTELSKAGTDGRFTDGQLIQIADFEPANLQETDQFKPNKEAVAEGRVVSAPETRLDNNDPKNRNHSDVTAKLKELFKSDGADTPKQFSAIIKQAINLLKIYSLNIAARSIEGEANSFPELQDDFRQVASEIAKLELESTGQAGDDQVKQDEEAREKQKQVLEAEKEEFAERMSQIVEKANEGLGITSKQILTDKNEIVVRIEADKQLSLEEEEHLIDLFTYQPGADRGFDTKFQEEQDRAFAKARAEFLNLPDTVSGYKKAEDGKLTLWFKIKVDPSELNLPGAVGAASTPRTETTEEVVVAPVGEGDTVGDTGKPANPQTPNSPSVTFDLSNDPNATKALEFIGRFGKDVEFTNVQRMWVSGAGSIIDKTLFVVAESRSGDNFLYEFRLSDGYKISTNLADKEKEVLNLATLTQVDDDIVYTVEPVDKGRKNSSLCIKKYKLKLKTQKVASSDVGAASRPRTEAVPAPVPPAPGDLIGRFGKDLEFSTPIKIWTDIPADRLIVVEEKEGGDSNSIRTFNVSSETETAGDASYDDETKKRLFRLAKTTRFGDGVAYRVEPVDETAKDPLFCIRKYRIKSKEPEKVVVEPATEATSGVPYSLERVTDRTLSNQYMSEEGGPIAVDPGEGSIFMLDKNVLRDGEKCVTAYYDVDENIPVEGASDIAISRGVVFISYLDKGEVKLFKEETGEEIFLATGPITGKPYYIAVCGDYLVINDLDMYGEGYSGLRVLKLSWAIKGPTAVVGGFGISSKIIPKTSLKIGPLAADPDKGYLYACNTEAGNTVTVVDMDGLQTKKINLTNPIKNITAEAVDFSNGYLYILEKTTGKLRVFDGETGQEVILEENLWGSPAAGLAVNGDEVIVFGKQAYQYNKDSERIDDKQAIEDGIIEVAKTSPGIMHYKLKFKEPERASSEAIPAELALTVQVRQRSVRKQLEDYQSIKVIAYIEKTGFALMSGPMWDGIGALVRDGAEKETAGIIALPAPLIGIRGMAVYGDFAYTTGKDYIGRIDIATQKDVPFTSRDMTRCFGRTLPEGNDFADIAADEKYLYLADVTAWAIRRYDRTTGEEANARVMTFGTGGGSGRVAPPTRWVIEGVDPIQVEVSEGVIYVVDRKTKLLRFFDAVTTYEILPEYAIFIDDETSISVAGDIVYMANGRRAEGLELIHKKTKKTIRLFQDPADAATVIPEKKWNDIFVTGDRLMLVEKETNALYEYDLIFDGVDLGSKSSSAGELSASAEVTRILGQGASLSNGEGLGDIAFNPEDGYIYVCDRSNQSVVMLDVKTGRKVNSIENILPCGIAYCKSYIYVLNEGNCYKRIIRYDAKTLEPREPSYTNISTLTDLAASDDGKLYIANSATQSVVVLDAATFDPIEPVISREKLGKLFDPVGVSVAGNRIYVLGSDQTTKKNIIKMLDKEKGAVIKTLELKGIENFEPENIIAVSDNIIFAVSRGSVFQIDTETDEAVELIKSVGDLEPFGLAAYGDRLYVTNSRAFVVKYEDKEVLVDGGVVEYRLVAQKPALGKLREQVENAPGALLLKTLDPFWGGTKKPGKAYEPVEAGKVESKPRTTRSARVRGKKEEGKRKVAPATRKTVSFERAAAFGDGKLAKEISMMRVAPGMGELFISTEDGLKWLDTIAKRLMAADRLNELNKELDKRVKSAASQQGKFAFMLVGVDVIRSQRMTFNIYPFEYPIIAKDASDIAADDKYIYVSSTDKDIGITRYDIETGEERPFDDLGSGNIKPWSIKGISVARIMLSDGVIYAADVETGTLKKFDAETSAPIETENEIAVGYSPAPLTIEGDIIFMGINASRPGLQAYDKNTFERIDVGVGLDLESGLVDAPIAAGDGYLYVADNKLYPVQSGLTAGVVKYKINVKEEPVAPARLERLSGKKASMKPVVSGTWANNWGYDERIGPEATRMAVDPSDGTIFVGDTQRRTVRKLSAFAEKEFTKPNSILKNINPDGGIAVDKSKLYVHDLISGSLCVFDKRTGEWSNKYAVGSKCAGGVAVYKNRIFVGRESDIFVFNTTRKSNPSSIIEGVKSKAMTVDDNRLYVLEKTNDLCKVRVFNVNSLDEIKLKLPIATLPGSGFGPDRNGIAICQDILILSLTSGAYLYNKKTGEFITEWKADPAIWGRSISKFGYRFKEIGVSKDTLHVLDSYGNYNILASGPQSPKKEENCFSGIRNVRLELKSGRKRPSIKDNVSSRKPRAKSSSAGQAAKTLQLISASA